MNGTLNDATSLIERLQTGVVVHGSDTVVNYANPRALELLRITRDQALGKDAYDPSWMFLDRHGRPLHQANYPVNQVQRTGEPVEDLEIGISDDSDEKVTWVLCSAYPEFAADAAGRMERIVVTFYDITDRKKSIPFEDIVERASDAVIVTDAFHIDGDGPKIVYTNAAAAELSGYRREEMVGRTPRMFQGPETDRAALDRIRAALVGKTAIRSQLLNYTRDRTPYWIELNLFPLRNDLGEVAFYAAIERDITETKKREFDLRELSIRDPLTGLHNRRGFLELADPAVAQARRTDTPVTVATLDIDHFKSINDTHGHGVGDRALRYFGQALQERLRSSDIVGRMGGEEFAILLTHSDVEAAVSKMEELRLDIKALRIPVDDRSELSMTASFGIAPLEISARGATVRETIDAALATADAALYRAKLNGRDRVMTATDKKWH